MASFQKTVLMLQPSVRQGEVWRIAMLSQDIKAIWEKGDGDLVQMLDQIEASGAELPQLLLIDISAQSINPYAFCRWCREQRPDLKIILTSANQKEISATERRWAIYQGAQDLLPGFQQETLLTSVTTGINRVMEVLDCGPLQQERLAQILVSLTAVVDGRLHGATPVAATVSSAPVPAQPSISSNPGGNNRVFYPELPVPAPLPQVAKPAAQRKTKTYRGVSY
ncbi:response regulator [Neosynechococcus sphagnicola]|uniref:response regulator n=1 Tax=Neosynechococcus sphagnicola TaxID=1501145 RepID=UPI000691A0E2|nr:response regulator [Neosynechococcus sphagnicola]